MCVYVNLADDKKPIESNNKSHGLLIQNLRGFRLKLTILVNFTDNIHENYLYVKSYFKKETKHAINTYQKIPPIAGVTTVVNSLGLSSISTSYGNF